MNFCFVYSDMDEKIKRLIDDNNKKWEIETNEEIKRRNKQIHAINTLRICNEYVTGQRKEKWIKDEW